jgi:hypothetical protein
MTHLETLQTKKLLKSFSQISKRDFIMKKYRSFVIGGVLCCLFALMAGCASSNLTDIWSDSSFQSPPLNKMLVISVSKNSTHRRIWEDAFSTELAKHNVAATPSYHLFPDVLPDTNQVIQIVRSNGFDGVLVTRRLPSEMKTQYVEGYMTRDREFRYNRRYNSFMTYYRDIGQLGNVDSQKVDIRTIDVWATKNEGQMIWSATSETPEPNSIQEVRPEIVKLVMSELTQHRMIASER